MPRRRSPDTVDSPARPAHLRPRLIALVALGGTIGTGAREALSLAIPPLGSLPLAIVVINLSGAFALGLLLEALARRGPDIGSRRSTRLLIGTGFLGGYTTYSALAADTAGLLQGGDAGTGIAYALGTVLAGAIVTWFGVFTGARVSKRREP